MRKNFVSLVCVAALLGGASVALAGAYGDTQEAEETPAAPPAAAVVQAEEEVDYARVGPYIGIGGNYAIENFDAVGNGTVTTDVGNSAGFHVRAGYRVHPNVAVEVLYEYLSEFDTDPSGHYDGFAVTGNVKGYMLTGRWQPYALFGLGYIDINGHDVPNDVNNNAIVVNANGAGQGLDMRFGLGMDANITEHIAIGPEIAYVLPFEGAQNFDMITVALGLRYKF